MSVRVNAMERTRVGVGVYERDRMKEREIEYWHCKMYQTKIFAKHMNLMSII